MVRTQLDSGPKARVESIKHCVGSLTHMCPRRYGTVGDPTLTTYFEPFAAVVGQVLCGNTTPVATWINGCSPGHMLASSLHVNMYLSEESCQQVQILLYARGTISIRRAAHASPQQYRMSCDASTNQIAVAGTPAMDWSIESSIETLTPCSVRKCFCGSTKRNTPNPGCAVMSALAYMHTDECKHPRCSCSCRRSCSTDLGR